MDNNRGTFSGNIGFILAAIGSAVGMGNLWGFPYKMGANGGFPFLIIYLVFVVLCGVVVMGVEMTIGRKTGKSPVFALAHISKKFKFVGWFGVLSATIITGFYSVLIGYALRYLWGFFIQIFGAAGFNNMSGAEFFVSFTGEWWMTLLFTLLTFVINYLIVAGGIRNGIEKFNKVGIPALFFILIAIIIYNFTLKGSEQGLVYMFTSKGMEMAGTEFNFFTACKSAAGQMLFSCSLGMGIMITYGSYLKKDSNISMNAWVIPMADTIAAILAGMAIFPAVFAQGGTPNGGPGLLYITLHDTFTSMGYIGNFVGFLFYLLVIFAGISSSISLMEVVCSHVIDSREEKGKTINRKAATAIVSGIIFVISVFVCIDRLGGADGNPSFMAPLYQFLADGSKDLLDLLDFITEGLMMPIGAIIMCLIVGWKLKMPWMSEEIELEGNKFHCKKFFTICVKYVTPLLMVFVLVALALSYLGG